MTILRVFRIFWHNPPVQNQFFRGVLSLVVAAVAGYLIGSIPFAYLLVRWRARLDIRNEGSGNVGTLNSYQVTGSKLVGIAVFGLDLLKGAASVLVGNAVTGGMFEGALLAGCAAVAGHNFPLWLRLKGGRGLAPAVGVITVLAWPALPVWLGVWGVSYAAIREVNVANAIATATVLILFIAVPAGLIALVIPGDAGTGEFRLFGVVICLLILSKLVSPVSEYLRDRNQHPGQ